MDERIKVKDLTRLLAKYPQESGIAFLIDYEGPGGRGTAYEFQEIIERQLNTKETTIFIGISATRGISGYEN